MAYVYLILAFLLNSAANLLLKVQANKGFSYKDLNILEIVTQNHLFFWSLIAFGANFLFYFLALRNVSISVAYPIMITTTFLIINSAAVFWLGEQIRPMQILGYMLIVVGLILVFSFSPKA